MPREKKDGEHLDVSVRLRETDLTRFREHQERLRIDVDAVAALSLIRAGLDAVEKETGHV